MAVKELEMVAYGLRNIALSRWTDSKIMNHIAVKLPAPIFDRLVMDLKAEMPSTTAALGYDVTRAGDGFTFAGVKFQRVDGQHWSVNDAASHS